jgi:hypothetical protein
MAKEEYGRLAWTENPNKYLTFLRHPRAGGDPELCVERVRHILPSSDGVRMMAPVSPATLDPRLRGDNGIS